jgi:hypothetical protein
MRFAWLKEQSVEEKSVHQGCLHPFTILRAVYNLVFWIFLLPLLPFIDNSTGFVAFTVVIGVRLVMNLYVNNILKPKPHEFETFPFRIP